MDASNSLFSDTFTQPLPVLTAKKVDPEVSLSENNLCRVKVDGYHDAMTQRPCAREGASGGTRRSLTFGTSATPPRKPAMESPHPDERPNKKRRFFEDNSSPAPVRTKPPSSPSPSPPPAVESDVPAPPDAIGTEDAAALEGFDVGMLQAVVGELSLLDLRTLKDVSGNNVERGRHAVPEEQSLC